MKKFTDRKNLYDPNVCLYALDLNPQYSAVLKNASSCKNLKLIEILGIIKGKHNQKDKPLVFDLTKMIPSIVDDS